MRTRFPPRLTLGRAFLILAVLLALVIAAVYGLVIATARELERAIGPLAAATQIRHEVLTAETRSIALIFATEAAAPSREVAVAARERASRLLDGLEAMARTPGEELPQSLIEDLNTTWEERRGLADRIFEIVATDPTRPRIANPKLVEALAGYTKASDDFNEKLQELITFLQARTTRILARFEVTAAALAALGLSVLAAGTVLVRRSVVRPLRRIADVEESVTRGQLPDPLQVRGGIAEIEVLERGFNEMVVSLRVRAKEAGESQQLLARRERSLDRRNRELAAANAELDAFAYAASHDLRAPLRGIESMARFLSEDVADKLDAEGNDKLDRIRRAARRLHELIDSLLEVARAGRELGPLEDVPLGEAVAHALESLEGQIRDARARVVVQPDMPTVLGDAVRLAQVFQNLIGNAVKYSSGPGRTARVEIGASSDEDGVSVRVRDNGIGIPADQHRRIFQLFRRLQREGEFEGTGVGLSIVDRIVRAHGGTISVESEPGKGSCFTVHLPRRSRALAKEAA